MASTTKVGIIGTGAILWAYAEGCRIFNTLELSACADLDLARAEAKAREFAIPRVLSVEALLADPEIEIVLNLTVPRAHAEVSLKALAAGKHVYSEKPLGIDRAEGRAINALADSKGLRVGCAPDTFLGGGVQTSRKVIDDGWIGNPFAAVAFMAGRGPEGWHPNPAFFYQKGGGPLYDTGPYTLTALVALLGPVRRVSGSAQASFPERIAGVSEIQGQRIPVEIPTHISGTLDFASGAIVTLISSFDVWAHTLPRIEVYGSEGSLSVVDPNGFGGPVRVWRAGAEAWQEMPLTHDVRVQRGIGVADMAAAIRSGRPHRANGQMAEHVLDVMESLIESSETGRHIVLETTCERPAPLPLGLERGTLD